MSIIHCNGADLYYEDHGKSQPIVFLHGAWAGCRYFEGQLTGLSPTYRAVAFDFRGHGRPQMIPLLEEFIEYMKGHDGVEFTTLETVAEKFNEDPSIYESEGEFV